MKRKLLTPMLLMVFMGGCDYAANTGAMTQSAARGHAALERYQCNACHYIPGVRGAHGFVGPSLKHFGARIYIAGELPNTAQMLALWIADAPRYAPQTAMPNLGVTARDARDMAAYLHHLR